MTGKQLRGIVLKEICRHFNKTGGRSIRLQDLVAKIGKLKPAFTEPPSTVEISAAVSALVNEGLCEWTGWARVRPTLKGLNTAEDPDLMAELFDETAI